MDKYVPLSKKSKKEQKRFHAMQRKTWNGLNPVTRTVPNGKAYDRNKLKRQDSRDFGKSTCCFCLSIRETIDCSREKQLEYLDREYSICVN